MQRRERDEEPAESVTRSPRREESAEERQADGRHEAVEGEAIDVARDVDATQGHLEHE